ncbi:MAG: ribosome biogenesis GTPase YqeH [Lactobacillus sp.]|jgi:ribosome biogenesis GTPase YqeH|nr:ribosome biogenesis GTPase YqeH [Lactobacillus sp.]
MNEIRCIGCGSPLQAENPKQAGYVPASGLAKAEAGDGNVYCKRCFKLRHYGQIMPVSADRDTFLKLLSQLNQQPAMIVNVVDLFDVNGSLLSSLPRFIGNNDFILVGNKIDLFPKNSRFSRIKDWLRQIANNAGLYPKAVFLVSGQTGQGVADLVAYLDKFSRHEDIDFVGMTNVGKSTLLNQIISEVSPEKDLITTSRFPGTTLDRIEIPFAGGHNLVDTPGIIADQQLTGLLDSTELKQVLPRKPLKPATYQLEAGQTLFLGGLGRIDYVQGPKTSFVVYVSRDLYVHRTKTSHAAEFYEKQAGKLLIPPQNPAKLPAWQGRDYAVAAKSDLLFGGIGFVTVPAGCHVRTYTPGGIGQGVRKALI